MQPFQFQVGAIAGEDQGCGCHPKRAPLLLTFPAPLPLRHGAPEDVEAGGKDGGHPTDDPPVPHHPGPEREGRRHDRSPSGREGGQPNLPLPLAGFRAGAPSGSCSPFPRGRLPVPTQPAGNRRAPPSISPAGTRRDPLRSQPDLAEPPARRSRRSTAVARSVSSRPKRLSSISDLAALRGRN